MKKSDVPYRQQQKEVNEYFQSQSSYWKNIYTSSGVQAEIYRLRQAIVLAWIDDLALTPGSRVLDIGCGAGFLSVELAKRGLRVQAIDSAETMVELARQHAAEAGVTELLSVGGGDVYALDFNDDSFDLVIALGVTSWLARPELAIREMARVTVPGGHVLLTEGNQVALHLLLDPWKNPTLAPLRRAIKDMLARVGLLHPAPKPILAAVRDRQVIDDALVSAKLIKSRSKTIGFGAFTFVNFKVLPERMGTALHNQLQRLSDRNVLFFRSTGMSYLVLAKKSTSPTLELTTSAQHPVSANGQVSGSSSLSE